MQFYGITSFKLLCMVFSNNCKLGKREKNQKVQLKLSAKSQLNFIELSITQKILVVWETFIFHSEAT